MRIPKKLEKDFRDLAKVFNCKLVHFVEGPFDDETNFGTFYPKTNTIEINITKCYTLDLYISVFLHELVHAICRDCEIYKDFHNFFTNKRIKINKVRKTAYNAEVYVDKQAEELMNFMFPDRTFHIAYYRQAPELAKLDLLEMIDFNYE